MKLNKTNIQKYLDKPKNKFQIFDLPISKKDLSIFSKLELPKIPAGETKDFSYYGNEENLPKFPENINIVEETVRNILKIVLDGYNKKHFWLLISLTYKDPSFDITRWHTDGKHFARYNDEVQSKFIMVLQGEHTQLLKETEEESKFFLESKDKETDEIRGKEYNTPEWKEIWMKYRNILNDKFKNSNIVQPSNSQGFIFLTNPGNFFKHGAIHSEPKKYNYRMFISILPGSEEEINNRKQMYEGTPEERESARKIHREEAIKHNKNTPQINNSQTGGNYYYQKYLKYKRKYLQLKKNES